MRKVILFTFLVFLKISSCQPIIDTGGQGDKPNTPDNPSKDETNTIPGYKFVWGDEFEGTALDETVWNIEEGGNGFGNNELQYYRRENVTVGKEPVSGAKCLIITAKRENYGGRSFTSARINSRQKKAFKYGRFDARIKLPKTANGLWPAFWMMGNDFSTVGWPRCGEIDILEMGHSDGIKAGTQDKYFNGACHWGFYKDMGGGNMAYPNYAKSSTWSYSLQDGEFHLFTLVWDEQYLRMYVDLDKNPNSKPYYEMGITDVSNDWGTGHYFHHDFFILFNLAVGGNFPGIYDPNGITALSANGQASMYVDYIRVYERQ